MKLLLLGNGKLTANAHEFIEQADLVARINIPPPEHFSTSERTDRLYFININPNTLRFLKERKHSVSPAFIKAREIVLPYDNYIAKRFHKPRAHPLRALTWKLTGNHTNCTNRLRRVCAGMKKELAFVDARIYMHCCALLDIDPIKEKYRPSTGFIALHHIIKEFELKYNKMELFISGFCFRGWDGHKWDLERRDMHRRASRSEIMIL